jgi:hypothetical protein
VCTEPVTAQVMMTLFDFRAASYLLTGSESSSASCASVASRIVTISPTCSSVVIIGGADEEMVALDAAARAARIDDQPALMGDVDDSLRALRAAFGSGAMLSRSETNSAASSMPLPRTSPMKG